VFPRCLPCEFTDKGVSHGIENALALRVAEVARPTHGILLAWRLRLHELRFARLHDATAESRRSE
jgi:hypothetical protein